MSWQEQCDYFGKLGSQFPLRKHRILFAGSGTQPAAVRLADADKGIAEHGIYWAACKNRAEADFLCSIINSETARAAAVQWQSEGQWGARHFDKAVFNLPIPLFDPTNPLHAGLAKAAAKSEKLAALVQVKEGEHFTRTRKRIRQALIANGVSGKIETLVAELIGVAPVAIVSAEAPDPEEADAD